MAWTFGRRKRTEISSTDRLFGILKALGISPRHLADVGANHGNWTRAALAAFAQAKLTMLQPQRKLAENHRDQAQNARVAINHKVLGNSYALALPTFHPRDDSSSSIYSPGEARAQGMEQGEVEICRLDTAMGTRPFGQPGIDKIDAEGLDLKVLEGAPVTISRAPNVPIEAAVTCPSYPDTAPVIFQKMYALGFRLFEFTDLNRSPQSRVLWLIEAVFVRKDTALAAAATHYQ